MTLPSFVRGAAAAFMVVAVPQATAETFTLSNGQVIEGTVLRSLGNSISIKYDGAGMLQVPIGDVDQVEIGLEEGGVVSGRLTGWSDGVYQLSTNLGPVKVRVEDGEAVAIVDQGGERRDGDQSVVTTTSPFRPADQASEGINAGFVFLGSLDDGGRTFMQDRGRQAFAHNPKVKATSFVEIAFEQSDEVPDAVDRLVDGGANLVFLDDKISVAVVAELAKRHRAVRFIYCGFPGTASNVELVCDRTYEARYLSGIIAGGVTDTGLVGYIAAKPTPNVMVGINAFSLGVQSVNPDADIMVRWTTSWYAPGLAYQQAEALVEQGVDVMTIHQDSPAALLVAERHGIGAIGFQNDMSAFAPSSTLTSIVANWGELYNQAIDRLNEGSLSLRPIWLGLRDGAIDLAPISSRVPDDVKKLVEQRQRDMHGGRFDVFTGPIRDASGDVRVLDGHTMTDIELQTMDFLIEGVVSVFGQP